MEKNYSILKRESALSKITKISITVFLLFFANQIFSQTITLKTASEFIIDSNNSCLPGFDGPHATYVSYEICNNTGSTLIGATATLGGTLNVTTGYGATHGDVVTLISATRQNRKVFSS